MTQPERHQNIVLSTNSQPYYYLIVLRDKLPLSTSPARYARADAGPEMRGQETVVAGHQSLVTSY
jgi:hypothetical protein